MKKTISIVGDIGTFEYIDEAGNVVHVNGLQLEDVIAQIERLPADTKELIIECGGLGGVVDVAKSMRGYLKSKVASGKMQITTRQVANLASANTIIFSVGSERLAIKDDVINPSTGKPYFIMVHEPLTPHTSGNADKIEKTVDALRADEDALVAIYSEDTGITEEAIRPLMKAETFLTGSKAVALKLATDTYTPTKQAAFHNPKNSMSKISKMALDAVLALLSDEDKAKVKKALAAAPPADLIGKPVLINGAPAVDGTYTVVGGVVTMVEDAAEETAEPAPAAAAQAAPAAAAAQASTASAKGNEDILAKFEEKIEEMKKAHKAEIVALKKSIGTSHTPVGFTPETKADDIKEWDRSFRANEHGLMKKNDPEKYRRIFYAKYGKMPNL